MCNEIRITSVAEFMAKLSNLAPIETQTDTRFFRGHPDKEYGLIPSIYRKKEDFIPENYLIQNEDKIIKEAFTYCADNFLPHENLFEKLAKLQHYDYSTRLLDISSNALVALYFSVRNLQNTKSSEEVDNKKDGEVIVLDIPNKSIKYDDSDTVAILSALSLRKFDFEVGFLNALSSNQAMNKFQTDLDYIRENGLNANISYNANFSESEEIKIMNQNYKDLDRVIPNRKIDEFNKFPEILKLVHDVRKDKPYFLSAINADDFNQVLGVKSKPNSPRISRQHGAFLLFGINGNKATMAEVPTEWINKPNGNRLIIDKDSKAKILQELAILGISSQTLFPELDKQAKPIMEKYRTPKSE